MSLSFAAFLALISALVIPGITPFLILELGAKTPEYLTRCIRGCGTRAQSFSINSKGENTTWVLPEAQGRLSLYLIWLVEQAKSKVYEIVANIPVFLAAVMGDYFSTHIERVVNQCFISLKNPDSLDFSCCTIALLHSFHKHHHLLRLESHAQPLCPTPSWDIVWDIRLLSLLLQRIA